MSKTLLQLVTTAVAGVVVADDGGGGGGCDMMRGTVAENGGCDMMRGIVAENGGNGGNDREVSRPTSFSLRRATLKDACCLTNAINEAYDHHKIIFAKAGTNRVAPDGTEVAKLMQLPCSTFLVAEETNAAGLPELLGCVHVTWSGTTDSKQPGVDAHFGTLSVPNRHAGRGIGKFLVSAAEECIRTELGRANIVVEITVVSIITELFAWYKAQGYEMGIVIPFTIDAYVREDCDVGLQLMTKTLA